MSGFGPSADWFQNLHAAPAEEIAIGCRRFRPKHRILEETEAIAVLADYERRNRLIAPIVPRGLSWLAILRRQRRGPGATRPATADGRISTARQHRLTMRALICGAGIAGLTLARLLDAMG